MSLGFGEGLPGVRWQQCGLELNRLAQSLEQSTAPAWVTAPARDPLETSGDGDALIAMDVDSDEDDNLRSFVPLDIASASNHPPPSTTSPTGPSDVRAMLQTTDADVFQQSEPSFATKEFQMVWKELRRVRRSVKTLSNCMSCGVYTLCSSWMKAHIILVCSSLIAA